MGGNLMNLLDIIIVSLIVLFVLIYGGYLCILKLKGKPLNSCPYCGGNKGNKLLKAYRKKYGKRCG